MSTVSDTHTDHDTADEAVEHQIVHEHPSDGQYVKIALILGVITALEVGTYFWEDLPFTSGAPSTTALILVLFPMMIAKFLVVAGYFMHLKYDNPLFKRVFVFGLILAVLVFIAAMATFEYFDDGYLKFLGG
jgi:cytochrome c oxidase subunit 4